MGDGGIDDKFQQISSWLNDLNETVRRRDQEWRSREEHSIAQESKISLLERMLKEKIKESECDCKRGDE